MKYLLDTCTVSDFLKGEPQTLHNIKKTSPTSIAVSSITVMEIQYGLCLNKERASKIQNIIYQFLSTIKIINFDNEAANISGLLRADLRRSGKPIGFYDILLAGSAISRNLIFVTSNTSEFSRINDLILENWRLNN